MVLAAIGVALAKKFASPASNSRIVQQTLLKRLCPIQVAGISGKALRDKDYKRPTPWPYKEKNFTFLHGFLDRTTHRFDENSKIVVVEGPIAAGKTAFAKALAEDLDMLYMPEANMDMHYINSYNFDMRQLDPQLPESCRSYDIRNFCEDPSHVNAANFQILMYYLRYSQYVDAVAHVLSTGQGVPHLVIYLDVPVATCLERIKKRSIPYEVKSKVFTPKYLEIMEEMYKQRYLKEISNHAELLIYDWSDQGDVEVVVEDIERIDFDRFEKHDPKMKDWRLPKEWDWAEKRRMYSNQKATFLSYFNVPRFDVPELLIDGHDALQKKQVWWNAPGTKYSEGYNEDMGDSGMLLKSKLKVR
ncbi:hypothetical protein B566_EDAN005125 [Ephemera danica]|nr:hypothetical protein B566_EDAN005125 [Ephemera danica]